MFGKIETSTTRWDNLVKKYILLYNFLQILGWFYVIILMVLFYSGGLYETKTLWYQVKTPVTILQTATILEVIHIMVGLVKTSLMVTASQISFRLFNVYGIMMLMPPDMHTVGMLATITSWSIAESIRYIFYLLKELDILPSFMTWIRYNAFIVCMPLGLTGELINTLNVQSYMAQKNLIRFKVPFTKYSLGYHNLLLLLMPLFLRGFWLVYTHMFSRRTEVLKGQGRCVISKEDKES